MKHWDWFLKCLNMTMKHCDWFLKQCMTKILKQGEKLKKIVNQIWSYKLFIASRWVNIKLRDRSFYDFHSSYKRRLLINLLRGKMCSDCNWTRTQNHLVLKRTLNHLAKLTKWSSCVLSTYLYGAFDCMFLLWIHAL